VIARPLLPEDVPAAAAAAVAALPAPPDQARGRVDYMERRIAHLQRTDPDGAQVAVDEDGNVVGVGLAIVRDGVWGLSLLGVLPDRHARGAGRAMLRACLQTAVDARGALILSSTDPKAMRLYARAGFRLLPCVALAGILDRDRIPLGLASVPSDDIERAVTVGRAVRGGAYSAEDLRVLRPDSALLVCGDRGFAVHSDGTVKLLCATDEEAATDLLWSCFAAATPGATVGVDFLTAGQDWAIQTGLEAGLLLSPDGPVFARGELGPLRPWVPSGALL